MPAEDSWTTYQREVMGALERHEKKIDSIINEIAELQKKHALLEVKSGLWGMLAGATLPGLYLLYELLKGK